MSCRSLQYLSSKCKGRLSALTNLCSEDNSRVQSPVRPQSTIHRLLIQLQDVYPRFQFCALCAAMFPKNLVDIVFLGVCSCTSSFGQPLLVAVCCSVQPFPLTILVQLEIFLRGNGRSFCFHRPWAHKFFCQFRARTPIFRFQCSLQNA